MKSALILLGLVVIIHQAIGLIKREARVNDHGVKYFHDKATGKSYYTGLIVPDQNVIGEQHVAREKKSVESVAAQCCANAGLLPSIQNEVSVLRASVNRFDQGLNALVAKLSKL